MRRPVVLLLLSVALSSAVGCRPSAPAAPRDVLLVVLDTVRADHLSSYGYLRETTPEFDRLAADGVLYREAFAQAPWTLPAVASILTGQPPWVHGASIRGDTLLPLRDDVPTLAERLGSRGYRTAAFVNVVFWGPRSGLARGFETYDYHPSDSSNVGSRNAGATTDAALDWIETLAQEPFLLVVHYFDPHLTYDPPAPYDTIFDASADTIPTGFGSSDEVFQLREGTIRLTTEQRSALIARYDGELRYADHQFGRLRRGLETAGRWEDTLVIVVADHGEEFWEHGGFEHGHSHHREVLHVPLIVRDPGAAAGESDRRVTQLDLVPTILDWAGAPPVAGMPGGVLGRATARAYAVAEGSLWAGDLVSVRGDQGTLILDRDSGALRYYAVSDPLEQVDLSADRPPGMLELERLASTLPPAERQTDGVWRPDPAELEQLRALGYLR